MNRTELMEEGKRRYGSLQNSSYECEECAKELGADYEMGNAGTDVKCKMCGENFQPKDLNDKGYCGTCSTDWRGRK